MQIKTYQLNKLSPKQIQKLCQRQTVDLEKIMTTIKAMDAEIMQKGDQAIRELTQKFDNVYIENFKVQPKEIAKAQKTVNPRLKLAIKQALNNIKKFTLDNKPSINNKTAIAKGISCWQRSIPIEKVGLYIPGGNAPLFSTVLMLGIPAKLAKCSEIILCTPPKLDGTIAPEILYTAKLIGIDQIYKIGGAQAILAMANGTKTIPKVYKIFGPGNLWVTGAKIYASQKIAIDMPAGPSEVLIIADQEANPEYIASDLLSQAEHGNDSQSILLCDDQQLTSQVQQAIADQIKQLPRQANIMSSLKKSYIIICPDLDHAIDFANQYAPEHLILATQQWKKIIPKIINAGSVFCGYYSPESAGDYASGTNHVLPTGGFAKSYSGLSISDFYKTVSFQHLTKKGLKNLGATIEIMAENEQLIAHKNAVSVRLS